MKRAAVIIAIVFALGLALSSCNHEACPAYSQVDANQIESLG
ncbi:MAG TPA: hypothetical protein VJ951_08215 [Bacteroidales bacterium]|nr:hypothetical protein [Bacteroidales bacterium]